MIPARAAWTLCDPKTFLISRFEHEETALSRADRILD